MKPIPRFLNKPKSFWASVRSLSQQVGYSKGDMIIIPTVAQMAAALEKLGLASERLFNGGKPTQLATDLLDYFTVRSRVDVKHYLMADAHFTWWKCGKAYLCRMFDMLHMGYADEILFGREVVEEMPRIVSQWVDIHRQRNHAASH